MSTCRDTYSAWGVASRFRDDEARSLLTRPSSSAVVRGGAMSKMSATAAPSRLHASPAAAAVLRLAMFRMQEEVIQ